MLVITRLRLVVMLEHAILAAVLLRAKLARVISSDSVGQEFSIVFVQPRYLRIVFSLGLTGLLNGRVSVWTAFAAILHTYVVATVGCLEAFCMLLE